MMKTVVLIGMVIVSITAVGAVETDMSYKVVLEKENSSVSLHDVIVVNESWTEPDNQPNDAYRLEFFSPENKRLYQRNFTFQDSVLGHTGGERTVNLTTRAVMGPYLPTATLFAVIDPHGNRLIEEDITRYSACDEDGQCKRNNAFSISIWLIAGILLFLVVIGLMLYHRRSGEETEEEEDSLADAF